MPDPFRQDQPCIVAHRGASFDAPENTLAAFRLALAQDADAIEGDFRVTRDGQVVCIHDANLRRFGLPLVVAQSTLADLRRADVGRWKSKAFAGEQVPTLAEVLDVVPAGKHLRLEIKAGRSPLPAIVAELKRLAVPADRVRLMAFNTAVVRSAKCLLPGHLVDWLIEFPPHKPVPTTAAILATLKACRADGLGTEARLDVVTPAFCSAIRAAGFDLGAWTVNDVALAEMLVAAGVTSITTDRPALFTGR